MRPVGGASFAASSTGRSKLPVSPSSKGRRSIAASSSATACGAGQSCVGDACGLSDQCCEVGAVGSQSPAGCAGAAHGEDSFDSSHASAALTGRVTDSSAGVTGAKPASSAWAVQ